MQSKETTACCDLLFILLHRVLIGGQFKRMYNRVMFHEGTASTVVQRVCTEVIN